MKFGNFKIEIKKSKKTHIDRYLLLFTSTRTKILIKFDLEIDLISNLRRNKKSYLIKDDDEKMNKFFKNFKKSRNSYCV